MVKKIIFTLLLVGGLSLYAQENPTIDKKLLLSESAGDKKLKKAIIQGDKYYKKGLYDAALQQYMKLYGVNDGYPPLNYKIAVSHLYGVHPKNALAYFDRTSPDVTIDYYCMRGIALVYHQQYDEAKEDFIRYEESLPVKQQDKKTKDKIDRFIAICDFSERAVQDSLPVFIINAGPHVNSYYDDYSAVEFLSSTPALYFTSRRPKDDATNIASHSVFNERILYSPEFIDGKASQAQDVLLKSSKHLSVAGVDNQSGSLLYFKGKKHSGDVYRTQFKENGKTTKNKRLKSNISKKTATVSGISFADNGDAFYISDRLGGAGGKDIWYAKKKGKNSFFRPQNLRELNTPLNEESVFVEPDGNTLYFSTNGLPGMGGYDIYKSVRMLDGTWSEPVNMGYPINGPDDDLFYRLTSDTTLALFSSKRDGGFGGLDVYYIKKDLRIPFVLLGNVTDENTGKTLNATVKLFDNATNMPVASAANDTLLQRYTLKMEDTGNYYAQAEAPGYRPATGTFINPAIRHAQVQLNFELEKLLHPYTLNGHITDVRTGKPVVAEVIIKQAEKNEILYRTVSEDRTGFYSLTMADKDNFDLTVRATDFFDHNERLLLKDVEEDLGSKNISLQRSRMAYIVTGVVTGEGDPRPLKANIKVLKPETGQLLQEATTEENEKYELMLADMGPFLLEVTSEGYFFANSVLQFSDDSTLVIRNFVLKKMESGAKMVIENILFNTGKATLMPESFNSLNKLVNLLRENPRVKIEVSGHTDNTGSAATNKTLSKNRALSVRNYLISQGIDGERVVYEGYGFDRPIAPNNTAEGRAANRRVEIEILD